MRCDEESTMMRLLLLSNSIAPGRGFLEHAHDEIRQSVAGKRRLLFIAFAWARPDVYTGVMRQALQALDLEVQAAHEAADPVRAIQDAETIFVGGGNSFRLLHTLLRIEALGPLQAAARAGVPYLGASAGAILACPTIRTTNDMPIVEPRALTALGLLPFQINPHYVDPDPGSSYQGETRDQRIAEFLEVNDVSVLGLREGSWLRVTGGRVVLAGLNGGHLFRRGAEAVEVPSGTDLSWLSTAVPQFDVGPN
jgi:dipeptidase E